MARTRRTNGTVSITLDMVLATNDLKRCGRFSRLNPTTPLNANPFVPTSDRSLRKAFGSKNVITVCPDCPTCYPELVRDDLTGDYMTACCGNTNLEVRY